MFSIDERFRGLPASREQVLSLYQSINSPHLAIPGKPAGPAQAFVLGLRGSGGFAVFIYLYLAEAHDCAVYVPGRRNASPEEYQQDEAEAL
ncbi:MAG TPA: social motility and stimulation tgl protein, partial [Archangium sp.]